MTIRPARIEDVPAILDLIRGLAEYERLLDQVDATDDRLRHSLFPTDGEAPVAQCVLACVEHEPVGFALYFFNYSTFLARPGLYLEDLFVKPAWRGRGYGKALFLHVAGIAHARACGRMEWAVLDWNAPAIAFYESLGARRLREWQLCRLTRDALAQLAMPG
jgi:GNAT superfamily N-acetyltransferase